MTGQVLRGASLAARIREEIATSTLRLTNAGGDPPSLATVLVGRDPAAEAYRSSIVKTLARVEIRHQPVDLSVNIDSAQFLASIRALNDDPSVTGILVLMPLPDHLPSDLVLEHLSPVKDVDGITPTNAGRLHMGLPSLRPSTPQGGIELLDHYNIPIAGARAVVIGRSNVVGRPLASLLMQRHATVTVCHRQTVDLASICREADVLAVAAGHPGLVGPEMVKPDAVVLDFGVNVVDGRIVGDVDFDAVQKVVAAITPVPGGTGPVTALVLARNTVAAGFAGRAGDLDDVRLASAAVP
ncbi:MAG: bifunctional 5,10-methylenetetrahydrofolate dehydrogenase/5,10-methenyltetrahydrofolate cyclohydrolase [Chloroflexota bacterium]|nr:bifunctional 5,10-methylenetetrahydrofolate dehydrogenase/5,10-methenyltetrahydrofolate cyclohydrolase [Chloroflexota bacterium]